MTAGNLIRADALRIPLRDDSVDLIVTSPPYFALRSYQDGGQHYDGQIGSEPTPQEFIDALLAVTAECMRVLKPKGSMFTNLGDKYSGSGGHNNSGLSTGDRQDRDPDQIKATRRNAPDRYNRARGGIPAKSLMLLPERYRIGCVDRLGLIARSVIIWDKPSSMPESVTDRVRRSHEDWVHLTKQGIYYSAIDEIREPYQRRANGAVFGGKKAAVDSKDLVGSASRRQGNNIYDSLNPLGKLPGSVWRIPSEPLIVPEHVGVDHYAAFPQEWPRRLILGWSPPGICTACGEGRTGSRCACPNTDAPTRPTVVLDPFVGTGTTVMVARALGRLGIGIDLSADYLRLARWRIFDSGHAAKTLNRTWAERQEALL